MILAQCSNVDFGYPDKQIVKGFTAQFKGRCRTGIIGANGCGKTTVFRLIAGDLEPDSGAVIHARDLTVGFLRQSVEINGEQTAEDMLRTPFTHLIAMESDLETLESRIADHSNESDLERYDELLERYRRLGGYTYRARIEEVISGLGFEPSILPRAIRTFSGGERSRIQLARILLENPGLLLLDEPTNHLDINAIEWLEAFLKSFAGGVVIISHDRAFLDSSVEEIIEIDRTRSEFYKGNYSAFLAEREERRRLQEKQYRLQQAQINKMEDFVRKNIVGQKTKQAQSRLNTLERMERIDKPISQLRGMKLAIEADAQGGRIALRLDDLSAGFEDRPLFERVTLQMERGDIVGVIGPNGSGKSTLLKTIMSEVDPISGSVSVGYNTFPGYYSQQLDELTPGKNVIDEIWDLIPQAREEEVRSYLGRFLFSGEDVFKPVETLSGGEKSRVALARLLLKKSNLLLLDEPTNHLDVMACDALENALRDYSGSVLMVTHDRFLLDRLAVKIWALEEGSIQEYLGNYSYYKVKREERLATAVPDPGSRVTGDSAGSRRSKRELRKARVEIRRVTGKSAKYYEAEIEKLEQDLADISTALKDPALATDWSALDDLMTRQSGLRNRLDDLMDKWETAMSEEQQLET